MSANPNVIDAGLKREAMHNAFLEAFVAQLLPISIFATDFSDALVGVGDEVKVGYAPLAVAAKDFEGTYLVQKTDWQKKSVVINKHKYVSMGLSDKDVASTPIINLQQQARQKAEVLAKGVLQDILSLVTAANYGAAVHTGAAGNFDADDVADIAGACDDAHMPETGRGLVLSRPYYTNVVKDDNVSDASKSGATDPLRSGRLFPIHGFTPFKTTVLPDNGEYLKGFAAWHSAIGVAMRYLAPLRPEKYIEARALKHAATGITLGFRKSYNTDTGVEADVFECNYGYAKIEGDALKRIVSQ